MKFFTDKVVLITGGSSGIGLETARLFLENDAIVYIVGRDANKLENAKQELLSVSKRINTISADIASCSECERVVREVISRESKLDILINSAGVSYSGSVLEMTEEMWDNTIDINLKGTFFMSKSSIPHLIKTSGCIVNVSSDSGIIGNKGLAIYCASKGGVSILTKALSLELAPSKVRVNAVCPGEVDTPMLDVDYEQSGFPTREMFDEHMLSLYPQEENARYIKPREIANSIMFLADTSKVEAITGTCLMVDFGMTAGY